MCLLCAVTSCSSFIIFFPPFLFLSFPFFLFFFPSRSLGPGNQIHRRRHAVAWPKGTPTAPMARWVRIYVLSPPHDRDLVLFARLISSTAADRYSLACPLSLFPFSRWPPRLSALRVHLEHRLHATRAPFQRPLRASESVPFPPSPCVSRVLQQLGKRDCDLVFGTRTKRAGNTNTTLPPPPSLPLSLSSLRFQLRNFSPEASELLTLGLNVASRRGNINNDGTPRSE